MIFFLRKVIPSEGKIKTASDLEVRFQDRGQRCFPRSVTTFVPLAIFFFRLKGQLCNTLSGRLALRNGAPPLTEADRKAAEERLQRLRRDADNKRLAIKNLKLALERLDITE